MKILVVKPALPYPPNQGTRRVSLSLLKALAPHHEVTLATLLSSRGQESDARELERVTGCRVVARLAPNRRSPLHRLWYKGYNLVRSLAGGHSPRVLYGAPGNLLAAADDITRRQPADLAIFEYWHSYPYFEAARARRRVLLAHDAEFVVNALAGQTAEALKDRLARGFWARTEAGREAAAVRAVDRIWTLTRGDAEALARTSGVALDRFDLMPFGVDTETLRVPAGGGEETVLFLGAFAADFNRDALRFLIEEIWPRVAAKRPRARLVVAGPSLDPAALGRIQAAGATFLGEITDLRTLYAGAAVVIIPLRFGGGLRIRLLEALACSRAVVATSVGVGGIDGVAGTHFLVADDAAGLADAVTGVLARPEEGERLGSAGRALIEAKYSEAAAATGIRDLVGRMMSE